MRVLYPFLIATLTLSLGACAGIPHAVGRIDATVDRALGSTLVHSSTSYSRSVTREGQSYYGDSLRRQTCTESEYYNRNRSRSFDSLLGDMSFDTSHNRGNDYSCTEQEVHPRITRPLF